MQCNSMSCSSAVATATITLMFSLIYFVYILVLLMRFIIFLLVQESASENIPLSLFSYDPIGHARSIKINMPHAECILHLQFDMMSRNMSRQLDNY